MLAPSMDAATKGATLCAPKSFIPYLPHQGVKVQSRLYVILEIDRCRFVGLYGLGILITSVHPQTRPSDPASHRTPCRAPHPTFCSGSGLILDTLPAFSPALAQPPQRADTLATSSCLFLGKLELLLHSWILRKEKGGLPGGPCPGGMKSDPWPYGFSLASLFADIFMAEEDRTHRAHGKLCINHLMKIPGWPARHWPAGKSFPAAQGWGTNFPWLLYQR